jgi:acyl-coenzyme A synthetase/AMP-(fatty) acid ligase
MPQAHIRLVPPAELEALLLTHPKVADAAVIAYPSPSEATELPRAYIVPKEGLDAFKNRKDKDEFIADVSKWVADKVANHKRLRGGVVLIEAIPKSPSGKILRKDLRAMTKKEIEDKVKDGREAKL